MLSSCPSFQPASGSHPPPFRVAVVDDHPLIRKAIIHLIAETPGLACCGEAATTTSALALVAEHQPELATIDLTLGSESGLSLIQAVTMASPRTRILVVSMHDERLFAERCLKAGASGYLTKDQAPHQLLVALCRLARGKTYLSEEVAEQILSAVGGRHDADAPVVSFDHLTDRERHVLTLIGHGLSTREIASQLNLSIKTVETHSGHLKEKLGLKSARELLRYAVIWGDEELPARPETPPHRTLPRSQERREHLLQRVVAGRQIDVAEQRPSFLVRGRGPRRERDESPERLEFDERAGGVGLGVDAEVGIGRRVLPVVPLHEQVRIPVIRRPPLAVGDADLLRPGPRRRPCADRRNFGPICHRGSERSV